MDTLSRRDFRAALEFLGMVGEATTLDEFAARLGSGIRDIIPSDASAYNEVNLRRQRIRWLSNVETTAADYEVFERYIPEHPMVNYFARRPLGDAVKLSDVVGRIAWRDHELYHELYRPYRLETMLGIEISKQPESICLVAFRDKRDFSDRDCALMSLLRPHLVNLYRNIEAMTDLGHRAALLQAGLDLAGIGAIVLRADNTVRSMTAPAEAWLTKYFGRPGTRDSLPSPIAEWLAHNASALVVPEPAIVDREEARLTLRLVSHGAGRLIVLQEQRKAVRPDDLAALGLARRESEILAWVVAGKTDGEIASILAISPRTVSHTLERVYRKLGVETRTAAAARALGAVRDSGTAAQ